MLLFVASYVKSPYKKVMMDSHNFDRKQMNSKDYNFN